MAWRAARRTNALAADTRFLVLCAWLALAFLFGGGSRADIQSLLFLRPAAVLVLAYGLSGLTLRQVTAHRFLFGLAAAMVALPLLHLVPLPPALWQVLPGRELVVEIDREAALGELWRPLSLAPDATRNALWALLVPLPVLVLGVQLSGEQLRRLIVVVLAMGLVSALLAVLQIVGDPKGGLYFYRVTNHGAAVGLYANRNHQAVFLATLVPMLVVWLSFRRDDKHGPRDARRRQRWLVPLAAVAFIVPLILITGSRLGLILLMVALLALPLFAVRRRVRQSSRESSRNGGDPAKKPMERIVFLGGIAAMIALTVLLGRATAIDRLLEPTVGEELRLRILPLVLSMTVDYAPWGSGVGTFEKVFQIHETYALLRPTYANHAHNDWLEVVLTGGAPAAVLLAVGVAAFVRRGLQLASPIAAASDESRLARLGLLIILLLGLASISDYPLRVPSLACLAVLAALWAGMGRLGTVEQKPGNSD